MNNYLEILRLANDKFVNVKDNKASFLKVDFIFKLWEGFELINTAERQISYLKKSVCTSKKFRFYFKKCLALKV